MGKHPQLMVMTGKLAGQRFSVPAAGLRLGRSRSNDIHIADEELSRNHCLFELESSGALRVIDLASANGTFVNSEQLGGEACVLKTGDIIEAGTSILKVVDEDTPDGADVKAGARETGTVIMKSPPAPAAFPDKPAATPAPPPLRAEDASVESGPVDLGLDDVKGSDLVGSASAPASPKRMSLANILWCAVALLFVLAISVILMAPTGTPAPAPRQAEAPKEAPPAISELVYEKIEADATHIFRYVVTLDGKGILRVIYDDVYAGDGESDRHVDESSAKPISDEARTRLRKIFAVKGWKELEGTFSGASVATENALKSWHLRVIDDKRVKDVLVENTPPPAVFKQVLEGLELFSRNELGVWALHYSKEKLLELSREKEKLADSKWDERDVEHGNTAAAVAAYKEAVILLKTVIPKPAHYPGLLEKQERAVKEMDSRYDRQRFLVNQSQNKNDWDEACENLRVLLQIVPDQADERHVEARAQLVKAEARQKEIKAKFRKKGGRR